MSTPTDRFYRHIWCFVRGDVEPRDFESWICENHSAEQYLGADLYLETISDDFRSADVVDRLRDRLRDHARAAWPQDCRCIELSDLAVVDMGKHEGVFRSICEVKRRGQPQWWLWLGHCIACNQGWLVAQEERQNVIFCMRKLAEPEARAVVDENRWPSDFDTYEALLEIGLSAGRSVTFVDPLESSSLSATIEDLALNRPGIRVSEIARLLDIDHDLARTLAQRVVAQTGVSIRVD
jgi:hypothetical protein